MLVARQNNTKRFKSQIAVKRWWNKQNKLSNPLLKLDKQTCQNRGGGVTNFKNVVNLMKTLLNNTFARAWFQKLAIGANIFKNMM